MNKTTSILPKYNYNQLSNANDNSFIINMINTISWPFFKILDFMPESLELAMGEIASQQHIQIYQGTTYHSDKRLCNNILKRSQPFSSRKLNYKIVILNSNAEVAHSAPNGKIMISKGFLKKIENYVKKMPSKEFTDPKTNKKVSYQGISKEDVLAMIINHEITHIEKRHGAKSIDFALLALSTSITLTALGQFHLLIPQIGASYLFSKWMNKQQEYEADRLGIERVCKAEYDPRAALFELEITKSIEKPRNWFQSLFADYPSPENRQQALYKKFL